MNRDVILEQQGVTISPDPSSAQPGGEATVFFATVARERLALKRFDKPAEHHREVKVDALIARPGRAPGPDGYIPWAMPLEKLLDAGTREFVGYAMRAVDVLGPLISYVDLSCPEFWPFADRVAFLEKLLAAYQEVESHPYKPIICDFSLANVVVDRQRRPVIVDVDSFQLRVLFRGTTKALISPAHLKEFLPPELQAADLRVVERTAEHHNFALAVGAYQILMGNRHPYATVPAAPYHERIALGAFPLAPGSGFAPPPGAQAEWKLLRPGLRDLFYRAFIDGHRDPKRRPSIAELHDEVAREVANPHPRPRQVAARPGRAAVRPGVIRYHHPANAVGYVQFARARARRAFRGLSRRLARVTPQAAAAAAIMALFGGTLLYHLATAPRVAIEPPEIDRIRAARPRAEGPGGTPPAAPAAQERNRARPVKRAVASPPLRPRPGWPAHADPPEIERIRSALRSSR